MLQDRLVREPVKADSVVDLALAILLGNLRRRVEQARKVLHSPRHRDRVEDELAVSGGGRTLLQQRFGAQPCFERRAQQIARRVEIAHKVAHAALNTKHDVVRDRANEVVDGRGQHALGVIIKAHRALDRVERHVDALLRREHQRGAGFRRVLNLSDRASSDSIVIRQANTQALTDLRASDGELVIILRVDVLDEGVGIFPQPHGFACDHVDSKKSIAHSGLSRMCADAR